MRTPLLSINRCAAGYLAMTTDIYESPRETCGAGDLTTDGELVKCNFFYLRVEFRHPSSGESFDSSLFASGGFENPLCSNRP
jgi:hypothetical protein